MGSVMRRTSSVLTISRPTSAAMTHVTDDLPQLASDIAQVDEPNFYFAESIKDFEPVDHGDNSPKLGEVVVAENTNVVFPEAHHERKGETAEYYRGDDIPTNVVLPEPDLGHPKEPEAHDDAVPVDTEREISGIEGIMVILVRVMTFHKKIDVFIHCFFVLFLEANSYFISTTGPFALCDYSVHHSSGKRETA